MHTTQRLFLLLSIALLLFSGTVSAAEEISLANSDNWVEVYSIMLHASLQGQRGFFVDADSTGALTKIIAEDDTVHLYTSQTTPRIANLGSQLESAGYGTIIYEEPGADPNIDLDINSGKYYLISLGNPRIAPSVAAVAVHEGAWVLVVDEENAQNIANKLQGANQVIAVGNFPRDVLEVLEPLFTQHINNNDVYADSQELANRFAVKETVILTDGSFIEAEFFYGENPVLLSGRNKILDRTVDYLQRQNVEAVVLVGSHLAVVGEQIREKTNYDMSVFVKFGQGDTYGSGQVHSVSTFDLPIIRLGLSVQQAFYDPIEKEVIVTFKNLGNTGVYLLSTISVLANNDEIGSTADEQVQFIGAAELLPITFPLDLPTELLNEDTTIRFYTSFGLDPYALDNFMTQPNQFGPPYTVPLQVYDVEDDASLLYLEDASYYRNLNRIGVELNNEGPVDAYYTIKINNVIVNGLNQNLFAQGMLVAGEKERIYLNVALDEIDLQENENLQIIVSYGQDQEFLIKTIVSDIPFKVVSGDRITGFVIGLNEGRAGSYALVFMVVGILVAVSVYFSRRIRQEEEEEGK